MCRFLFRERFGGHKGDTMELLVIRHGQSEADILGRLEGRADYELTNLGIRQAETLAEWISRHHKPHMILSSPLKRAHQTAEIIAKKTHVDIHIFDELMEFDNGLIAGLTFEEADERYPKILDTKPHESHYGQETFIQFRERADKMLHYIASEYPKDYRIAIVSHGGMINMLFGSFLGLPIDTDIKIATGDTGVHLWKVTGGVKQIVFQNSVSHLNEWDLKD